MKTADLEGQALDYWVARAEGVFGKSVQWRQLVKPPELVLWDDTDDNPWPIYRPSSSWAQGGPIIERERMALYCGKQWIKWRASITHAPQNVPSDNWHEGPTPLIAAMRCFVASKFGAEVSDAEKVGDGHRTTAQHSAGEIHRVEQHYRVDENGNIDAPGRAIHGLPAVAPGRGVFGKDGT